MVCVGRVFFRADGFSTAFSVYKCMFVWSKGIVQIFSWTMMGIVILLIAALIAVLTAKKKKEKIINGFYPTLNLDKTSHQILFITVLGMVVIFAYTGSIPFIYFQF